MLLHNHRATGSPVGYSGGTHPAAGYLSWIKHPTSVADAQIMSIADYLSGTKRWRLSKVITGTFTELGSFTQTLTAGVSYTLKLAITNAT